MQYMEWGINVPIMLILSGYCTLGRSLHEVSRPLVVTNIYVILCWVATATVPWPPILTGLQMEYGSFQLFFQ